MFGPCLCGDPYCPRCGDPSREIFEAAYERLCERIEEEKFTSAEFDFFIEVGFAAVMAHRKAVDEMVKGLNVDHTQYVDHLLAEIDFLKNNER